MALCPAGLPTTPEALQGIAAQGFWGAITTSRLERLVRRTLANLLRGRKVYIPGVCNNVLSALGRLVPPTIGSSVVYSRWKQAQAKWLTNA